jgi:hypothetical protein
MTWDEFAKIVGPLKDVVLALVAVVTAGVAVRGLNKWHHELSGKNEYEVARNLIRATYRLREELRTCRSPFFSGAEFATEIQDADAWRHVYVARFARVAKAVEDLDTYTLEAEALWGGSIRPKTDELRFCVSELRAAIEAIIGDKLNGGQDFTTDGEFGKRMRATAHASLEDGDNDLSTKIRRAIEGIEEQVRPHMAHR